MNQKNFSRREYLIKSAALTTALLAAGPAQLAGAEQYGGKTAPDLFAGMNRAADPNNLQGLELGHVPIIKAPDSIKAGKPFEVEVVVGQKLHEMTPAHYIDWIDLYADEVFLTKMILTPNFTQPAFKTTIVLATSATLRAVEHCNLHGLWEGTKKIVAG